MTNQHFLQTNLSIEIYKSLEKNVIKMKFQI